MKNYILPRFFIALTITFTFTLTSCKKESVVKDTSLTINVYDEAGNVESGAEVTLFTSMNSNDGITQSTDSKGMTKFKGLSPIVYYYSVISGCKSNVFSNYQTTAPIVLNAENQTSTMLKGTGAVTFVNNSSNPYRVYANNTIVYESMTGKSTEIELLPSGQYTFRVLQLSGYVLYPTDQSNTGNLQCGGTLSLTFP